MHRLLTAALAVLAMCSPASAEGLAPAQQIAAEIENGKHPGFESFVMKVDGQLAARAVLAKRAERIPDLRSATKSITAILIGIAIDQGKIPSVQAKLVDLLPVRREVLSTDPRKAAITVEDLLTMRSGLDCNDWDPRSPGQEDKMYKQTDWVGFWAEQKMRADPGKEFSYCTGNAVALGEVISATTGMSADSFALKNVFAPMNFERAEWEFWNHKFGVDTGGHLHLMPDDFVKLGELVLHRGVYNGTRIVSETWIDAMTQERASIPKMSQRYGYFWWIDHTKDPATLPETKLWWAQGNGGTFLIVLPGVRSVIAITGTRFNRPDGLEPMFWLRDRILPAMKH